MVHKRIFLLTGDFFGNKVPYYSIKFYNIELYPMSIQSLNRAIAILNMFRNTRSPLGISEIAHALGLAKTTIHGLVSTLEENGFLQQDPSSRKYRLGFTLFELGAIQTANLEINQRAIQPLQKLADTVNVMCRLAVWDRDSILITMNLPPRGNESLSRQFGPRLPAYCTALGKAMLAHMPESEIVEYLQRTELIPYTPNTITDRKALLEDLSLAAKRGYSLSNQEVLSHQVGLGAPVFNDAKQVVGAVSLRLDPENIDTELMFNTAGKLVRTAQQISQDMGFVPVEMRRKG